MGISTLSESHSLMLRRPSTPSFSPNHRKSRPPSPEEKGDLVVKVDGVAFALHKAPLCARSGQIRKLVNEHGGSGPLCIEFPKLPGGADAFSLVVKFCYGVKFEIDASNVAVILCVATYLEMTEEYGTENLIASTELFLRNAVFKNLKACIQVLSSCQSLLLQAEEVKLTGRCIDAIALIICGSDMKPRNVAFHARPKQGLVHKSSTSVNWWAHELLPLPLDFFKQTILAVRPKGLQTASIVDALMHYAQEALRPFSFEPFETFICGQKEQQDQVPLCEYKQRITLETIVNLLPIEKGIVPIAFLFGLLRIGYLLDTTIACHMELEKRIGAELEHATLEELLIPSSLSQAGDTLFDVDFVQRLVTNFVQQETVNTLISSFSLVEKSSDSNCPSQMAIMKVAELFDLYLAEVAPDPNLKMTKFINLMELLPNHARVVDDGMYRAIDIYLKAHPIVSEEDRRRICKSMDCQRLSQEARAHAAQNDRLPVHLRVHVLYVEQLRLHSMLSTLSGNEQLLHVLPTSERLGGRSVSRIASPSLHYACLEEENEALKTEIADMREKLSHLEKQSPSNTSCLKERASSAKRMLSSVSRTLSHIKPFRRGRGIMSSEAQDSSRRWVRAHGRRDSVS